MTVIIAKNQTAGALALNQLSVPDREIPASGQVTLTDWNTLNEIQDDEELLTYVSDGYVLIDRDGVLLSQADSVYTLTTVTLIEDGYDLATKNYVDGYVVGQISLIDHGDLLGLGDDDHTQYILADGTRAFSGAVSGQTPTVDSHLSTKGYVDSQVGSINTLSEILSNGNVTDGYDIEITNGDVIRGQDTFDLTLQTTSGGDIVIDSAGIIDASNNLISNVTTPVSAGDAVNKSYVDGYFAGLEHHDLLGLGDDDHTQYLLADGTRAMSGALDMGTNNITNVGTVDGVDVSAHASRHEFGGADQMDLTGLIDLDGYVVGPASATDTALVRYDGTTGKLVQDSGITVDGSDNITGAGTYNGVTVETHASRHEFGGADQMDLTGLIDLDGYVTGPGSATDTAITLFDGTTGKLVKSSGITVDGSDNITNAGTYNGVTVETHASRHEFGGADQMDLTGLIDLDGYVTGPASATDTALVRYDGTTGKLVQNSGITVDGSDNVSNAGTYNGVTVETHASRHEFGGADQMDLTGLVDLDGYLLLDGSKAMTGDLDLGSNDITNPGANTFSTIYTAATTGTRGDFLYRDVDNWAVLPAGDDGYVLTTHGTTGDPAWEPKGSPALHAYTHENGGTDEIDVTALSGELADAQKSQYRIDSGGSTYTRRRLNLIAGTNINLGIADDAGNEEVDITVNSTAGGIPPGTLDGYVVGPDTATDTAITLFDGTTGKLVKSSGITVDGSDNITNAGTYNGVTVETHASRHEFGGADQMDLTGLIDLDGYVVGPASATDTALVRYDGTTGKLVQDSGITVDGSDNITNAGTYNGVTVETHASRHEFGGADQMDLTGLIDLDGYVTGPASATDTALVRYDGTTGKLVQDSGITVDGSDNITGAGTYNGVTVETHASRHEFGGADQMDLTGLVDLDGYLLLDGSKAMTGDLDMGTNNIINVVDPVDPQDAATKNYVDGYIASTNEWSEILANGNTTGGTNPEISSGDRLQAEDGSDLTLYTSGSGDVVLDVNGTDGYIIFNVYGYEAARFEKGDVYISGYDGYADGGDLEFVAGSSSGPSGTAGDVYLQPGQSTGTDGIGGSVNIYGGSATNTGGTGGNIILASGSGESGGGGNIDIFTGSGTNGTAGDVNIYAGVSSAGTGGNSSLAAGNGSTAGGYVEMVSGGVSAGGSGDGGEVRLTGSSGRGAGNVGGNIVLTTGGGLEGADDGYIIFKRSSTEVARFDENNFLDVQANRIVDVQDPVDPQDAVTKSYVDGYFAGLEHGDLLGLGDDDHTQYLLVNGTRAMSGDLDMGTNNIVNVVDPVNPQDAATKNYIDGYAYLPLDGSRTMTGDLDMGTNNIINVVDPANPQDAATKNYVDGYFAGLEHGDLLGLGDDDHTQYLLVNGTRAMSGDLDMGTNNITNVVDPIDPQDAATRNYVDGYTADVFDITQEPSGFPNTTDSTISVVPATRTFTIQPTATSYDVLFKGRIVAKTATENVVWTDVEGLHFFYFDSSYVLQHTTLESVIIDVIYGDGNFISALYWNATDGYVEFWAEERHGFMPGPTHAHFHLAFGAQWVSGGALGNLNAGGSGDLDSSAQFSVGTVTVRDEDLSFTWSDGSPQEMSPIAEIPIYYRSGASGDWRKKPSDQFNIIYSGTAGYVGANGRAAYNEDTGATWQLTQLGEGKYVLVHYYATDEINEPIIGILGQNEYSSAADATAGATNEINDLQGTADLLALEHVALATTIWETKASFGNTPTARIVQTTDGFDYIDWRGNSRRGTGGVSGETVHANLSGLLEDDHTQYLLVDGTRAMDGDLDMDGYYVTNVADPINLQDAATKGYVDGYVFSELASLEHGELLGLGDDDHTQYLLVNGTRAMTGDLDLDNAYNVINSLDPVNPQDAATKNYVDGYFAGLEHGDLLGLGDDDHTQYLLVNGTRAMTGDLDLDNTYNVINSVDPVNPQDLTTKNYVDGYIDDYLPLDGSRAMTGDLDLGNNDVTNPGVNTFSTLYGAATDGTWGDVLYRGQTNWVRLGPSDDGYVLTTRGASANPEWYPAPGASGGEANVGSNIGTDGYGVYDSKSSVTLRFRNIDVISNILTINYDATDHDIDIGVDQSNIDHGSIGGLGDDDHTQYALLAGRSGGQTLIGGTGSGDDLVLKSTSHATAGNVILNDSLDADGYDIVDIDVATNDAEYDMGNQAGSSLTLNANNGNFQKLTLTGNITSITMTAPTTGVGRFQWRFIQDAGGTNTVTGWPASVLWPGGTDPTFSTGGNDEDIVTFFYNGTNWYGIWAGDFS